MSKAKRKVKSNQARKERAKPRHHHAFLTQMRYKPDMPIEITDDWNLQARVLQTLREERPKGMTLKEYLTPIAQQLGISYESLYKWVAGITPNPRFWTVAGTAQYLDNTLGKDWY